MSAETKLTARQRIVDSLAFDLNAQGWDQPNKIWFVKGEVDDEWLEFIETFSGAPEMKLVEMITADKCPDDATGVVIATEGWTYPASLMATFKNEAALRSFWRLSPPSEHPQRVETRQLIWASADGEVIGLVVNNEVESDKQWAHLDANTVCPTGDRTIDAARGLLGLNDAIVKRIKQTTNTFEPIQKLADVVQKALTGELDQNEATLGIFNSMPEEIRIEMVKTMPAELKDTLRRLLSEEEQRKYGL